jgi:hypothetical protein
VTVWVAGLGDSGRGWASAVGTGPVCHNGEYGFDREEWDVLTVWDAGVLAQAYGLDRRQVAADAGLLTGRTIAADDLIAILRDRHAWSAAAAYRYLRSLHRAVRHELPS